MNQALRQLVTALLVEAGNEHKREGRRGGPEVSPVRIDYSGRGMMGRRCVGIDGSREEIEEVLHTLIYTRYDQDMEASAELSMTGIHAAKHTFREILKVLADYREDSMGLDTIRYWPELEVPGKD